MQHETWRKIKSDSYLACNSFSEYLTDLAEPQISQNTTELLANDIDSSKHLAKNQQILTQFATTSMPMQEQEAGLFSKEQLSNKDRKKFCIIL